jgi:hypothetical protein
MNGGAHDTWTLSGEKFSVVLCSGNPTLSQTARHSDWVKPLERQITLNNFHVKNGIIRKYW